VNAPKVDVLLHTGEHVPLESLYADRRLVLVFLRHCGCIFAKEQVSDLRFHPNLNIAFVSMGNLEQTRDFRERSRSPHSMIVDPDRELYRAFGLGRGEGKQLFSPKTFARGFGATLRGHWVGKPVGDPWQMPGVFLIEPDGTVSWEYRSVHIADNVPADRIVAAMEG
jgi:peroxiredoxin